MLRQISAEYFIITIPGSSLSKPHAAVTFVRITNKKGHYNPAFQPTHKRELKYFSQHIQHFFDCEFWLKQELSSRSAVI